MKKRLTSLLIVLCLVLALVPTAMAASAADFTDVKEGTWYYDYVNEVVSKGYFKGESSTIFSPDKQMTRAMFVTVLSRVDGATVNDSKSTFDDVPVNQWYTGAVTWANENKIVLGTGGKNFEPNRAISRIDMCLIMSRYISYYAAKTGQVPATTSSGKTFSDISGLDAEAKAALDRCVTYGLIEGTPEGTFKPYDTATRAEVAAVISRLAWTTTGGGGVIPIVSSITYYQNHDYKDVKNTTRTGTGSLHVLSFEDLVKADDFVALDGYKFVGWNEDRKGNGEEHGVGTSVTGVVTLYAQWEDEEPPVPDHIYEAMVDAVDYTDEQVQGLYTGAIIALKSLQSDELNKVIDAAADKTSVSVALNSRDDHQIDVTLRTDANDQNVIELAKFAYHYAMALYRGNDQEGGGQGGSGQTTADLKERIKALLDSLGIDYSGSGWSEKIQNAAQDLADLGKDMASTYKADLKKYFKNVDASDLQEIVPNGGGTTSVTEAVIKAGDTVIFDATKDDTVINRQTLKDIAKKLHEAVQDTNTGAWQNIQELAAGIDGEITFEPADEIAEYYGTGSGLYSPVYTVNFIVETGTEEYLAYKYAGGYDHFQFAPTQAMWDQYTAKLRNLKSAVAEQMKNNAMAVAAPYGMRIAFFGAMPFAASSAMPASVEDGGQMTLVELINMLDDMFKQVTDNPNDTHVDNAIAKWQEANKENFTEDDMIDVLLGEKELDMDAFNNSAIDELIDQLVTEAVDKVSDDIGGHKAYDYERIEDLLDTKGGAQEVLGEAADAFFKADGTTPKPGYEGIVDHLFTSLADKFNDKIVITDPAEQQKAAEVKEQAQDKTELDTFLESSIQEQMSDIDQVYEFAEKLDYTDKLDEKLEEIFPGENPKEALEKLKEALKLFDDLMNPKELSAKTLGGLVEAMGTDTAMGKVMSDRWDNYSGRVQSVFNRVNGLINRLLNTRYGDTVENATIQIGEGNNKIQLSDIQGLLKEANCSDYADFVEAINRFVTDANIGDLSIGNLGTKLITVEAGNYTYSFYVEIDLSNVH